MCICIPSFFFFFGNAMILFCFVFKTGIGIERKTIGGDKKKKAYTQSDQFSLIFLLFALCVRNEFAQKPVDFRLNKLLQFFVCPVGAVAGGDFL